MSYFVFLGCYTHLNNAALPNPAEGIYGIAISEEGKLLSPPKLLAKQSSPSYCCLSRDQRILYAVCEAGEESRGAVYAYHVDEITGDLEAFSCQEAPGRGLCHLTLDPEEKNLMLICYPDATVQVYPLDSRGGVTPMFSLRRHIGQGPVKERQETAHAHGAFFRHDGERVYVCDLGIDTICTYTLNFKTSKLHRAIGENIILPPGCGPRHLVFSGDGAKMYVVCELSSQVMLLRQNEQGVYQLTNTYTTLSPGFPSAENYPSAIRMTADERFLYVSNRGEDTIACFRIHPESGELTLASAASTMGWYPRDFILTKDQRLLIAANQLSDDLVIFRIDGETGALTLTDQAAMPQKPIALLEATLR